MRWKNFVGEPLVGSRESPRRRSINNQKAGGDPAKAGFRFAQQAPPVRNTKTEINNNMAEKDKKCCFCNRELYDGKHCIFHSRKPGKDSELFQKELDAIFEDKSLKVYDFSGFVFPEKVSLPKKIDKKIIFSQAIFRGQTVFTSLTFEKEAFFGAATFQSDTMVVSTTFQDQTVFGAATFEGRTYFSGVAFNSTVNFSNAVFQAETDFSCVVFQKDALFQETLFKCTSHFWQAIFQGMVSFIFATFEDALVVDGEENNKIFCKKEVDFRDVKFLKPEKVGFKKVNLSNFRFLGTDLRKVEFVNVDWYKKERWLDRIYRVLSQIFVNVGWCKESRKRGVDRIYRGVSQIYDEIKPDPDTKKIDYPLVAQVYKRLRANYEENLNYAEAGDFHIGEMECKRKSYKTKVGRNLCLTAFYKYVSNYGEGYRRTFYLWILPMLILFPLLFMYSGIEPVTPSQSSYVIDYDFHGSTISVNKVGDWAKDYLKAFVYSLSVFSLVREKQYRPIDNWGHFWMVLESILSPVLIAFFLLALRRRFRR
jgi:uncharacterized protein YjbI with pentapeptide repeats